MKITDLRYTTEDGCVHFSVPFKGEEVRCKMDVDGFDRIQRECSSIQVFRPKPNKQYIRVYARAGRRQEYLHRFLLGLSPGDPLLGDHKNNDTLDYRGENLRSIEFWRNCLNRRAATIESDTGIRGVYGHPDGYNAQVCNISVGTFRDIRDAAEAVWRRLIELDPVAATNYLRSLPDSPEEVAA